MYVNRKSNVGLLKKERAMIFQSKCAELPEGIQCADSVITFNTLNLIHLIAFLHDFCT